VLELNLPHIITSALVSNSELAPSVVLPSRAMQELIQIIDQVPQLEIPVTHHFSPGVYAREITMPAGLTGVGHVHKHRHLNIALTGHALVTCDGITQEVRAPFIFESMPGAQKAFHVFEDLRWITFHANPKEIRDIVEMEREIFDMPQEMIDAAIPVDDYRMTKRSLCQD
jgi:hypothetical protein